MASESSLICAILCEQGVQVTPRSYRAWRKRSPPARTIDDATLADTFSGLRERDQKGRQKPEVLYGRQKMTAWLVRQRFDGISKHIADRLIRQEGMCGLIRGRKPAPRHRLRERLDSGP